MERRAGKIGWLVLLVVLVMLALPATAFANLQAHVDDVDGDGVFNDGDRDTDNDGVLDIVECGSDVDCPDLDGDGVRNSLDLDSDGDGITDAHEAFGEDADGDGRYDLFDDQNQDGADDALVRQRTPPIDTDADGTPDYLQLDSDGDGIDDAIEGHDGDGDGAADHNPMGVDKDQDGLDDAFDAHCIRKDICGDVADLPGTPAPTPDHDGDGIEDFRDPVDDSQPGEDVGVDAGSDVGVDVGPDVGEDIGVDVGADIGVDTGVVDVGPQPDVSEDSGTRTLQNDMYVSGGGCSSVPGAPIGAPALFLVVLLTYGLTPSRCQKKE